MSHLNHISRSQITSLAIISAKLYTNDRGLRTRFITVEQEYKRCRNEYENRSGDIDSLVTLRMLYLQYDYCYFECDSDLDVLMARTQAAYNYQYGWFISLSSIHLFGFREYLFRIDLFNNAIFSWPSIISMYYLLRYHYHISTFLSVPLCVINIIVFRRICLRKKRPPKKGPDYRGGATYFIMVQSVTVILLNIVLVPTYGEYFHHAHIDTCTQHTLYELCMENNLKHYLWFCNQSFVSLIAFDRYFQLRSPVDYAKRHHRGQSIRNFMLTLVVGFVCSYWNCLLGLLTPFAEFLGVWTLVLGLKLTSTILNALLAIAFYLMQTIMSARIILMIRSNQVCPSKFEGPYARRRSIRNGRKLVSMLMGTVGWNIIIVTPRCLYFTCSALRFALRLIYHNNGNTSMLDTSKYLTKPASLFHLMAILGQFLATPAAVFMHLAFSGAYKRAAREIFSCGWWDTLHWYRTQLFYCFYYSHTRTRDMADVGAPGMAKKYCESINQSINQLIFSIPLFNNCTCHIPNLLTHWFGCSQIQTFM